LVTQEWLWELRGKNASRNCRFFPIGECFVEIFISCSSFFLEEPENFSLETARRVTVIGIGSE